MRDFNSYPLSFLDYRAKTLLGFKRAEDDFLWTTLCDANAPAPAWFIGDEWNGFEQVERANLTRWFLRARYAWYEHTPLVHWNMKGVVADQIAPELLRVFNEAKAEYKSDEEAMNAAADRVTEFLADVVGGFLGLPPSDPLYQRIDSKLFVPQPGMLGPWIAPVERRDGTAGEDRPNVPGPNDPF